MNESLDKDIDEYHRLDKQKKAIETRLSFLNDKIKRQLISHCTGQRDTLDIRENISYFHAPGYKVELQVKRKKAQVDQVQVEQLFTELEIYDKYATTHIPEHAIEQAYLDDELSDKDLRELRETTEPQLALQIKEVNDV